MTDDKIVADAWMLVFDDKTRAFRHKEPASFGVREVHALYSEHNPALRALVKAAEKALQDFGHDIHLSDCRKCKSRDALDAALRPFVEKEKT